MRSPTRAAVVGEDGPAQLRHRRADPARPARGQDAAARPPRKMPSMAGFDLEVTGYDEAPPARQAVASVPIKRIQPDHRGAGRRVAIVLSRFNPRVGDGPAGRRAARAARSRGRRRRHHDRHGSGRARNAAGAAAPRAARRLRCAGRARRGDSRRHLSLRDRRQRIGVAACRASQLEFGIPIGNGILTCDTDAQAEARMDAKGYEAALAALELANLIDAIGGR